ncbi:MAG: PQQ-binding-like beta-propeller repeat protein [Nitrosomonadales bacterium]|nr:PQQ-binding-like beta-propeller repeat protein [Nitrosomonadales bacterium]
MSKVFSSKFEPMPWLVISFIAGMAVNLALAITAANTTFTPQAQPVGYVAQDEVTSFILTSGKEKIYRPEYGREFWNGNLHVYPVDAFGNIDLTAESWVGGAAAKLALQNWDTGRYIATRNAAIPSVAIPFRYASLSSAQQAMFPTTTINTTSYTGTQIVNFLRGERVNESPAGMRNRSAEANGTGGPTLGDIIHSRPYYVADATNPTVFVGANDGMLHAFNATTGAERWAYVPSMLLPKMINLAKPYGTVSNPHDYFVDGRINVGTVSIGGTSTRILVSGLGAGGRGLFALKIDGSNGLGATSEADVVSKALWQINGDIGALNNTTPAVPTAYDNLGYTYGTPLLLKVNAGGLDAVVIGNGYNNNPMGDYQAYLYVINAETGELISSIPAGTSGSSSSPNGLLNAVAIDTNGDNKVDRVYAGDLKGTLWKFDLSSTTTASWTASALFNTSPAQPITSTPGVALHPNGGYMVTFGTGAMLDTADTTDTSVYYVYGIWDGAPVANTSLMTSTTLEERNYVYNLSTTRVRRSLNITTPNWSSGGHLGWQVALPAGERVVGDGSYIESGRFYFTSYNPTVSVMTGGTAVNSATVTAGGSGYTSASASFSGGGGSGATATVIITNGAVSAVKVTSSGVGYTSAPTITITGNGSGATATATLSTGTTLNGENWLMELDYLSGGSKNSPFLDLDGNQILNDNDRIKYVASDTIPSGKAVGDFIAGTDGIPVGKFISNGVLSQPILVQLQTLNTTFFNQNPDKVFPVTEVTYGVTGGHFDVDIFYNGTGNLCTTTAGVNVPAARAYATITVGTTGQTALLPATLGGIQVDSTTILPALTVTDITDGTATATNATTIKNKITGGYTATLVGNVITVSAPATGSAYNGKLLTVLDGTSQAGTPAVIGSPGAKAVGKVSFTYASSSTSKTVSSLTISVNGETLYSGSPGSISPKNLDDFLNGKSSTNYVIAKDYGDNHTISITAKNNGTAYNQPITVSITTSGSSPGYTKVDLAGGQNFVAAQAATGWSNFKPALTVTPFLGGSDALTNVTVTSGCRSTNGNSNAHIHQYDDKYDRTGVDMLNPSATSHKLSNAITSTATKYKVLVHNQYLNPAVKLHIGDATYEPAVDKGYVSVKNFQTSAALDVTALPTYNGTSNSTGTTGTGYKPIGSLVFNMPTDALSAKDWWGNGDVRSGLHPIEPGCGGRDGATTGDGNMYQPVIPPVNGVDGPGVKGWSASTVSLTASGVRHGGALTIQIIKDTTPQSAIEQNLSGRPEYGWRVKSADYAAYVLAEYTVFWHHPSNGCYGASGWTKAPGPDNGSSSPTTPAAGSTDPKLGDLSGTSGGTVTSVNRTVVGNVTTTTITYSTGKTAIITRTANADGTTTINTRDADCVSAGVGCTGITETIAAPAGVILTGGDERGTRAHTGRVSWHELIRE